MELARFEDLYDIMNIISAINNANVDSAYILIDGISSNGTSKADFYWSETGEKIPEFYPWDKSEPNNLNGREDCVAFAKHLGFLMNDVDCNNYLHSFLCQIENNS